MDSPIAQKYGSTYPTYQKVREIDQISGTCCALEGATFGRFSLLCMCLNNCERNLPFSTVPYKVIAGYKCSSEFTFEQEKQYLLCQQFPQFSFDDHVNSTYRRNMVLPLSFSRKMGVIETVQAEKMRWLDLPRGTSYPTFPYIPKHFYSSFALNDATSPKSLNLNSSQSTQYFFRKKVNNMFSM